MKTIYLAFWLATAAAAQQSSVLQSEPSAATALIFHPASPAVTDAERQALQVETMSLDCHLTPATATEEMYATLQVRNVSATALHRVSLQVSGSLRWTRLQTSGGSATASAPASQALIDSDTDHTGTLTEATLELPQPLAPGATVTLTGFFSGKIEQSSARLAVLGADPTRIAYTEWDQITQTSDAGSTALRGFGDVVWYPVSAPVAALGEGNQLFELVARERRLNAQTVTSLRLSVEYRGDPPEAAIFNGRLLPLDKLPDLDDTLVDETHGVATAEFAAAPLGVRPPSLFLTAQRAAPAAGQLLNVITPVPEIVTPYAIAATQLEPLMTTWFGAAPLEPLTLLDHPGAPFEDEALIVAHLSAGATAQGAAPELVRGMTHSYFRTSNPAGAWLDEGMAELMSLLWTERNEGRQAALGDLKQQLQPLALAEPDFAADPKAEGQPLTVAWSDIYLRAKSASVLWQLRELLGDEHFKAAIAAYRHSLAVSPAAAHQAGAFRAALEKAGGTDLAWFFSDWVDRDRGLPDLTVVRATARAQITAKSQTEGYLIAVEVKNDGDAIADVPVTIRSAEASIKDRLRVSPHSSASLRIFFRGHPDTLEVNDGSVPEQRVSVHSVPIEVL